MRFYQEITLIKTPEISPYFIWGKLYMQLHFALVEQQNLDETVNIGVSFPEYKYIENEGRVFSSLGEKLRVFAPTESQLTQSNVKKWLERLTDYCHISSIRTVPEQTQYAIFSRKQCVNNPERLARRRAKRKGETFEQALAHFAGFEGKDEALPFVAIESLSTASSAEANHRFKLSIAQQLVPKPQEGNFSCYGLSQTATVPWF
jgi:CRISPR-associated endonuclease Csy4